MSRLKWLLIFLVFALGAFEDSVEDATLEYETELQLGRSARRRRLISVQNTLTKIKHHMKRASELRQALRAELEKRHRAIAEKMRKQIEKQKSEMLGAHKNRMKKLAEQMSHFKKQMAHHKQMEAEFREKMEAMKDRMKKIHGIEMTEDGEFKRMKDKFGSTDGKDNEIVRKAVAKAKAKARKRLNKARDRMMKVLQQAEDPTMGKHRTCLTTALKNMVQVKGHIPHEKDPTDYADPADAERHKGHMDKARKHLKLALQASRDCHKLHQGPFHQFGEDDEYVEAKKGKKKGLEVEVQSMNPNERDYSDDDEDSYFESYMARRKLGNNPLVLPRKS